MLLNGPRYWLMDTVEKDTTGPREVVTFGGIEMLRQHTVTRNAVFVFADGRTVFELVDADGRVWVMQTFSQAAQVPQDDLTNSYSLVR